MWYNSHICCNGKFNKVIYNSGIKYLKDIVMLENNRYRLLTYGEIQEKYSSRINFLDYATLCKVIPSSWKEAIYEISNQSEHIEYLYKAEILSQLVKVSKYVYSLLINNVCTKPEKALYKWNRDLNLQEDEVFEAFNHLYTLTYDIKIRMFQFKVLHRIIPLNKFLFRIGIVEMYNCSFCHVEPESIIHIFCECNVTRNLWFDIQTWLTENNVNIQSCSKEDLILCNTGVYILDILCLVFKYYIFVKKCKQEELTVQGFRALLKRIYETDRYIVQTKNKYDKWKTKWQDITHLL